MPPEEESKLRSILTDFMYAIAVGIIVYQTMDQLTDGSFGRDLSLKVYRWRAKIADYVARSRTFNQQRNHVLFDAIETVEEG